MRAHGFLCAAPDPSGDRRNLICLPFLVGQTNLRACQCLRLLACGLVNAWALPNDISMDAQATEISLTSVFSLHAPYLC